MTPLLEVCYLCLCLSTLFQRGSFQEQRTGDVSSINRTEELCVPGDTNFFIPSNVTVAISMSNSQVRISWSAVSPPPDNFSGYEILYWPVTTTNYTSQLATRTATALTLPLNTLRISTRYAVAVRINCDNGSGHASPVKEFETNAEQPSATVNHVRVELNYQGVANLVRLSWEAIPEDQWNGRPLGYYLYLSGSGDEPVRRVYYPDTERVLRLNSGTYVVTVIPVNHFDEGRPGNGTTFTIGGESPTHDSTSSLQIFNYPYVYILIAGVVSVVVVVALTIVIFKKIADRWRGMDHYKSGEGLYSPSIPLHPFSPRTPPSSSASFTNPNNPNLAVFTARPLPRSPVSEPGCTLQAFPEEAMAFGGVTTPTSNLPFMTGRPLPRSPMSEPGTTLQPLPEEDNMFLGSAATNVMAPARKMPHPGPMPQLNESSEVGFVPMTRSFTDNSGASSVFTSTQAHAHPGQRTSQHPSQRSNSHPRAAKGSYPSPYEVPENGNTLPRSEVKRPSTAHAMSHHRAHNIPPPPAHSPPMLTQSNEIFPAVGYPADAGHNVGHRRGMQQRSYSTTAADNFAAREGSRGKSLHSDSRLPRLDAASEERMVYIRPPLDSSVENSMNNGMYPMEVGFEVKSPHHAAHMPEDMNDSRGRGRSESVFSETSTEMSNSDSIRDGSPGGMPWDFPHRGTASDIGVGHRRQRSRSPGREIFSEVGDNRPVYRPV